MCVREAPTDHRGGAGRAQPQDTLGSAVSGAQTLKDKRAVPAACLRPKLGRTKLRSHDVTTPGDRDTCTLVLPPQRGPWAPGSGQAPPPAGGYTHGSSSAYLSWTPHFNSFS